MTLLSLLHLVFYNLLSLLSNVILARIKVHAWVSKSLTKILNPFMRQKKNTFPSRNEVSKFRSTSSKLTCPRQVSGTCGSYPPQTARSALALTLPPSPLSPPSPSMGQAGQWLSNLPALSRPERTAPPPRCPPTFKRDCTYVSDLYESS